MITRTSRHSRGFTLTELLIVIVIIGVLLTFILVAARDSVRTAMEKATYALIVKLETGLNERLEAVLAMRGEVTLAHRQLSATYLTGSSLSPLGLPADSTGTRITTVSDQRAQVFAQFDQVRAEIPDVWVPNSYSTNYPLNFGGLPFPKDGTGPENFVLPLGKSLTFTLANGWQTNSSAGFPVNAGSGIFGASYTAAAGIYKNLGYQPQGYDGVDNGGILGLVDDLGEGIGANTPIPNPDDITAAPLTPSALISGRLANHKHSTARSEMLYALLVEGQGSIGSVFARDDFTQNEVKDTDGDGLPEFVDAWGEPLRFYRWPIFYSPQATGDPTNALTTTAPAYIQKGPYSYRANEARQKDPLDPSDLLVSPAWWWSTVNTQNPPGSGFSSVGQISGGAAAFMNYFHSLVDPSAPTGGGQPWDRGGTTIRRAFYSRPLIISGGPDKALGIPELFVDYKSLVESSLDFGASSDGSGAAVNPSGNLIMPAVIQMENPASQLDLNRLKTYPLVDWTAWPSRQIDGYFPSTAGLDDISNHSLSSPGGGVR